MSGGFMRRSIRYVFLQHPSFGDESLPARRRRLNGSYISRWTLETGPVVILIEFRVHLD